MKVELVMVGVCKKCGKILERPYPTDTAICTCKANPHPVQVALKLMLRVSLKQLTELQHPTIVQA